MPDRITRTSSTPGQRASDRVAGGLGDRHHGPRAASPAARAARARAMPARTRVKSRGRSTHERSWTVRTYGTPREIATGAGAGSQTTSTSPPSSRSSRGRPVRAAAPKRTREGSRWRTNRSAPRRRAARPASGSRPGANARHSTSGQLGREGGEQLGRIVRDAAAAGEVARVDADPQCLDGPGRRAPGPSSSTRARRSRPELGGVERWARELSARLPQLDPAGYRVVRPPARSGPPRRARLGAGRAAGGGRPRAAPPQPRERRPARLPAQRRRDPRRRRAARAVLVLAALRRVAARAAARAGAEGGASRDSLTVLPARADRPAQRRPGEDQRHPRRRRRALPPRRRSRTRPCRPRPPTARTSSPSRAGSRGRTSARSTRPARRLAAEGIEVVAAGGDRPQFREARVGRRCGPLPRPRARRAPARPLRGRRRVRAPVAARGFRADGARGDGGRGSGGRVRPRRAAGGRGGGGGARRPGGPGAVADAVARVLGDPEEAARMRAAGVERAGSFSWEATAERSTPSCAGCDRGRAPRPSAQLPHRLAERAQGRLAPRLAVAHPPQPRVRERLLLTDRGDSHVYQ